ncbi:hypothetical protein BD413DRAFT_582133 [Trametes elegans]|nr:hypothetical protein BD413DRAFT_582133 [Trametes elegans]
MPRSPSPTPPPDLYDFRTACASLLRVCVVRVCICVSRSGAVPSSVPPFSAALLSCSVRAVAAALVYTALEGHRARARRFFPCRRPSPLPLPPYGYPSPGCIPFSVRLRLLPLPFLYFSHSPAFSVSVLPRRRRAKEIKALGSPWPVAYPHCSHSPLSP